MFSPLALFLFFVLLLLVMIMSVCYSFLDAVTSCVVGRTSVFARESNPIIIWILLSSFGTPDLDG